jgi:hypothetical protein
VWRVGWSLAVLGLVSATAHCAGEAFTGQTVDGATPTDTLEDAPPLDGARDAAEDASTPDGASDAPSHDATADASHDASSDAPNDTGHPDDGGGVDAGGSPDAADDAACMVACGTMCCSQGERCCSATLIGFDGGSSPGYSCVRSKLLCPVAN